MCLCNTDIPSPRTSPTGPLRVPLWDRAHAPCGVMADTQRSNCPPCGLRTSNPVDLIHCGALCRRRSRGTSTGRRFANSPREERRSEALRGGALRRHSSGSRRACTMRVLPKQDLVLNHDDTTAVAERPRCRRRPRTGLVVRVVLVEERSEGRRFAGS
jgi:hypothetical protein